MKIVILKPGFAVKKPWFSAIYRRYIGLAWLNPHESACTLTVQPNYTGLKCFLINLKRNNIPEKNWTRKKKKKENQFFLKNYFFQKKISKNQNIKIFKKNKKCFFSKYIFDKKNHNFRGNTEEGNACPGESKFDPYCTREGELCNHNIRERSRIT